MPENKVHDADHVHDGELWAAPDRGASVGPDVPLAAAFHVHGGVDDVPDSWPLAGPDVPPTARESETFVHWPSALGTHCREALISAIGSRFGIALGMGAFGGGASASSTHGSYSGL